MPGNDNLNGEIVSLAVRDGFQPPGWGVRSVPAIGTPTPEMFRTIQQTDLSHDTPLVIKNGDTDGG